MRLLNTLLLLIFGIFNTGFCQNLTFTKFPSDWQLFQRDLSTNRAAVPLVFSVFQSAGYSKLEARLFNENGTQVSVVARNLTFVGGKSDQNFSIEIPTGCNNHRLEIHCFKTSNSTWVLEKKAEKLLAGDIFIINGQSNAQAAASPDLSDVDEYTRSWQPPYGWGTLNLSFPGLWGARLANRIADDMGIPVAIFNQAVGALTIDTYQKNATNPMSGNYGSLLKRFDDAGLPRRARAAIWFHGEADAWAFESAPYVQHFQNLVASWKADFQIERAFLFQMRYQSCNSPRPFIMEAHRQCGNLSGVEIMSSTNAAHDSCHFYYQNGYRSLGDRMFDLFANRFYGRNVSDVMPPNIERAYISATNEITIETKNATSLQVIGSPWADFKTEGAAVGIVGGMVSGTHIRLQLAGSVAGVTGISYLGHPGGAPHWVVNSRGVGLLTWHNVALVANPNGGNTGVLTFSQPADVSATASAGATSAVVNFPMPTASSTCFSGAAVSQISGLASGASFPVGTSQVCFRATDACGNAQTRCFNVVVSSTGGGGNAGIDCSNIGIEAGSGQINISQLTAPVTAIQIFDNQWVNRFQCLGNCQTPNQIIPNLAAGKYFVKVDFLNANWQAVCKKEAFVDVLTTTPPPPPAGILSFPSLQNLNATASAGSNSAVVNFPLPTATSTCPTGNVLVSQISGLVSGSSFPVGTSQVCFRASDGCSNSQSRCFNVVVEASAPPTSSNIDLELAGSSTAADPAAFSHFSVKFVLKNIGNAPANQIKITATLPNGIIYRGGSEFQVSAGTFNLTRNEWQLASLAAGDSAVLTLNCFNLNKNPKIIFAQVTAASPNDVDSTPNNATAPTTTEDDEVAVRINSVAPPPPPMGIDLELELAADPISPGQWKNVTLTLTLRNRGSLLATGVQVNFMNQSLPNLWAQIAYVNDVAPAGTTFDHWLGIWQVPQIAAGQTLTLRYDAFTKVASAIEIFAEVTAAIGNDLDSSPANSTNNQVQEDDEVKIILNRPNNLLAPGDRQSTPLLKFVTQDWQVFPNPASEQLSIYFENAVSEEFTLQFFDAAGIVRHHERCWVDAPKTHNIDLSDWQNGLYFLQISSARRRPLTQKILVKRMY